MRILLAIWLWLLLAGASASASAQVVVLRVDPAAERLSELLEQALASYVIVPDPGYFAEAQRRGLDPQSDQTLALLIPPLRLRLAVVPRGEDVGAATIEFRDGGNGASLGSESIPLMNGALSDAGRTALDAAMQARLGTAQTNPRPAPESSAVSASIDTNARDAGANRAADVGPNADEPALLVTLSAGIGAGTRSLAWPSSGETLAFATGAFPAVELGARVAVALSPGFALGPELGYQTSLHSEIKESHIAGADASMNVRAERFAALLAATFSFGSRHDFQLAPAFGVGVRSLHPAVHQLLTPSYSLVGPVAQLRARIPFGDRVALRLAPELHYVLVGQALRDLGVEHGALSVGAEAAFELVLTAHFALDLGYREAHALLHSTFGSGASDVERFFTVRVLWEL